MDNSKLSIDCKLTEKVKLHPSELHSKHLYVIDSKLRQKLEGKCTKWGYIMYNSIRDVEIDNGFIEEQTTSGFVNFYCRFKAYVVNPTQGALLKCEVTQKAPKNIIEAISGKWHPDGFETVIYMYLTQMVTMEHYDNVSSIQVGDTIIVEILDSTFKYEKDHIQCLGRLFKKFGNNDKDNSLLQNITSKPRSTEQNTFESNITTNQKTFQTKSNEGEGIDSGAEIKENEDEQEADNEENDEEDEENKEEQEADNDKHEATEGLLIEDEPEATEGLIDIHDNDGDDEADATEDLL